MKKILLFTAFVALTVSQSFAQLSTRENYDVNLRLGTRPQAGDASLQFVLPIGGDGPAHLFRGNALLANDFLTYKYYHTDDVVIRAGLRWSVQNAKYTGAEADSSFFNNIPPASRADIVQASINRDFAIAGGLEKHFTNSNIFDVYAGGEIMLGFGRDRSRDEIDFQNGSKDYTTRTTNTRLVGFGLVTGFNVFIAELPLSVGLEYGLTGKWLFGGKTHVERESVVGSVSNSGEWYEQESDAFGDPDGRQYSELKRRTFNMNTNHNVRLSINIYFSTLSNPRNAQ